MPKGSSILRKSSMLKIISQDAFVMSVYQGSLYVGEGKSKEGKPGVEKTKQLFKVINFPSKICLKGLKNEMNFFTSTRKSIHKSCKDRGKGGGGL